MKIKTKKLLLLSLVLFSFFLLILNIFVSTRIIYHYQVNKISTNEKVVMLTFDDGPQTTADNQILDILEAENVSGTFFQVGKTIEEGLNNFNQAVSDEFLSLEKRILTGPSFSWIGNHTYSHNRYVNKQKLAVAELNKTHAILEKIYQDILDLSINQELVPTRLSYLQYFNGMDYISEKTNNKYFIRGYLGHDYKEEETGKKKILSEYLSHLKSGQIFVCHTRNYAQEWLGELIHTLKDKGYKFASFNPASPSYYKNFGKLVP
ncbi:polysaccharide deacetylase family protein [Spiroplasma platyhelix]|uniref:Polysaccharide deacetylase family protein n=1 Tax=Spiroplasma platyhelix PALS-1 TaxID=1276218 RepID=A0A846TSD5_9MOLU|nr:polysaccharide deacetylase family protein [Spiroplasma platyhelix]MBE4704045.1 hypothetical protein [Spiroplasma platyhelix PALS-1]NKE38415.1 polysaccharide deacetylase family protein [Spiroplasma platyhelix PALS-1]UJB29303.1 chitin deacetylase [Spiroplasma platyhelix PALS-1]